MRADLLLLARRYVVPVLLSVACVGCANPFASEPTVVQFLPISSSYTSGSIAEFLVVNRASETLQWRACDEQWQRRVAGSVAFEVFSDEDAFCGSGVVSVDAGAELIIQRRIPSEAPPGDYRLSVAFAAGFEPVREPRGVASSTVFVVVR